VTLRGAGATFPALLYMRWFGDFSRQHPGVQVNYEAVGSGEGVKRFLADQVDFAASDAAMTDEEIAKVPAGVQMIPMTAGSIVLAYNPMGMPRSLKLSREAYSGICLGKVRTWDAPVIAASSEGTQLPGLPIVFVYRAEKSGTTFVFTRHLSAISPEWEKGPGVSQDIKWPVGVSAKGDEGVANLIKQTPGAIGYLGYGFARQAKLPMADLENNAGSFVAPTADRVQEAMLGFTLPRNLRGWTSDPPGKTAYPLVTLSWWLCYHNYRHPNVAQAMRNVVRYGLREGQTCSSELGYIPLPGSFIPQCMNALRNIGP
jgi:phosphate transport system substrate-binding protein